MLLVCSSKRDRNKVLDEDVVRTRVKVGAPVRVHYVGTGDSVMVDRVILDDRWRIGRARFAYTYGG